MNNNSNHIQLQYQGYLNTPLLWKASDLLGLNQLVLPEQPTTKFTKKEAPNLRLGKRVEQFVFSELETYDGIKILLENAQIQNGKQTVGEIDCILKQNETPIHLEIVYKFYLYDSNHGKTELEHWIGPNRNDTLIKKLTKLKEKQLPLLYNNYTAPVLNDLNLKDEEIKQYVIFKAQLFTPYNKNVNFNLLNKQCLKGFYIHYSKMEKFSDCKFCIPNKIDWLQDIQNHIDWLSYVSFLEKLKPIIAQKTAPLCWIKRPNGLTQKCFVIWWD